MIYVQIVVPLVSRMIATPLCITGKRHGQRCISGLFS